MVRSENKYYAYDNPRKITSRLLMKHVYYRITNIAYAIVLKTAKFNRKANRKKYYVSICAIFKNEGRYLKEWIEFHKIIGINHFYMYNNNSEDNYLEILKPYIEEEIVTLVEWKKNQAQLEAYAHCISKHKEESNWIGFVDLDEFIIPIHYNTISDFLAKFMHCPSVKLNWKVFGTSGKINRQNDSLVIEDFTICWNKIDEVGKCFLNTSFIMDLKSKNNKSFHHDLWGKIRKIDCPPVNCFGHICRPGLEKADSTEFPILINHYFTKSYKEYVDKSSKGDVYFTDNPHNLDYFYKHEKRCCKADFHAYKYLIELKKAMNMI